MINCPRNLRTASSVENSTDGCWSSVRMSRETELPRCLMMLWSFHLRENKRGWWEYFYFLRKWLFVTFSLFKPTQRIISSGVRGVKWSVISVWFMSRMDNKGHDSCLTEHRCVKVLSAELKCYTISITYAFLYEHKDGSRRICPTSKPPKCNTLPFSGKKKYTKIRRFK